MNILCDFVQSCFQIQLHYVFNKFCFQKGIQRGKNNLKKFYKTNLPLLVYSKYKCCDVGLLNV